MKVITSKNLLKSFSSIGLISLFYIVSAASINIAMTQEASAQSGSIICEGKTNPELAIEISSTESCYKYYYKLSDLNISGLSSVSGTSGYDHFQARSRSKSCKDAGNHYYGTNWDMCDQMNRVDSSDDATSSIKKVGGSNRKWRVKAKRIYFYQDLEKNGPWEETDICLSDDGCSYTLMDAEYSDHTVGTTLQVGASGPVFNASVGATYNYTLGNFNAGLNSQNLRFGSKGHYQHQGIKERTSSHIYPQISFKTSHDCQSQLEIDQLRWIGVEGKRISINQSGTKVVYYGKSGCLRKARLKDNDQCKTANFGKDPLPGLTKHCYLKR